MAKVSDVNLIEDINITGSILAKMYGLSPSWIQKLKREGLPRNKDKTYHLVTVIKWIYEHQKKQSKTKKENRDLTESRKRLTELQGDLAEIELKLKRGEIVPFEDVQHEVSIAIREFKNELQGISRRLAADLANEGDTAKCRLILQKETTEVLNGISEKLKKISITDINS